MRTRSPEKHAAIIEAAVSAFLEQGFTNVSMDQIAEIAGVSKRTIYDHFGDKDTLFEAAIDGMVDDARAILSSLAVEMDAITDLDGIEELAVSYASRVLDPRVVRLRRLMVREADRFPDLAGRYFHRGPAAAIAAIGAGLRKLHGRGLLDGGGDFHAAATDFAYLVLGPLLDAALFHPGLPPDPQEVETHARAAAATWCRAYARR